MQAPTLASERQAQYASEGLVVDKSRISRQREDSTSPGLSAHMLGCTESPQLRTCVLIVSCCFATVLLFLAWTVQLVDVY